MNIIENIFAKSIRKREHLVWDIEEGMSNLVSFIDFLLFLRNRFDYLMTKL